MLENTIITIDGSCGTGKSTVGNALAKRLGARVVDTGLIYRAIAHVLMENGIYDFTKPKKVKEGFKKLRFGPANRHCGRCLLRYGKDRIVALDKEVLANEKIANAASIIARIKCIRRGALDIQRALIRNLLTYEYSRPVDGVVVVGRDCGTVVAPEADLKIMLGAKADTRMYRKGDTSNRDIRDYSNPFIPDIDPLHDNDFKFVRNCKHDTVDQVVDTILMHLKEA